MQLGLTLRVGSDVQTISRDVNYCNTTIPVGAQIMVVLDEAGSVVALDTDERLTGNYGRCLVWSTPVDMAAEALAAYKADAPFDTARFGDLRTTGRLVLEQTLEAAVASGGNQGGLAAQLYAFTVQPELDKALARKVLDYDEYTALYEQHLGHPPLDAAAAMAAGLEQNRKDQERRAFVLTRTYRRNPAQARAAVEALADRMVQEGTLDSSERETMIGKALG